MEKDDFVVGERAQWLAMRACAVFAFNKALTSSPRPHTVTKCSPQCPTSVSRLPVRCACYLKPRTLIMLRPRPSVAAACSLTTIPALGGNRSRNRGTYFPQKIEALHKIVGFHCPILDMAFVQSFCRIIDALLNNNTKEATNALKTMNAVDKNIIYEAKSSMISARLPWQNTGLTCFMPTKDIIHDIKSQMSEKHLIAFSNPVQKFKDNIVNVTIDTLYLVLNAPTFLPSVTEFQYQLDLKDASSIFQGLLNTKGELFKEPTKFLPAWMRDGNRVFSDRMVDLNDMTERASVSEKAVTKDKKAVIKPGISHAFLLTGGQISEDRFLVLLNNLLSSGNIPDLFTRELYNGLMRVLRNQAKASGALEASVVTDDRDDTFGFFMDKVGKQLHLILRHSPVADTFRIRERKFPALISCMVIDEFHPWPRDALHDVSNGFWSCLLDDGNVSNKELRLSAIERRYDYATPNSFLKLIDLYSKMLQTKQAAVMLNVARLEQGWAIMEQVQEKVNGLKEDLNIAIIQVDEMKTATGILIDQVPVASEKAVVAKEAAYFVLFSCIFMYLFVMFFLCILC
eukprot:GEMP01027618.1.p1 GENE.GEMP01027618.1~~GEMP01027618.1.p1  ORF type:complete len:570 (-),score=112.65 GEMP01027618.1:581-2290(-)